MDDTVGFIISALQFFHNNNKNIRNYVMRVVELVQDEHFCLKSNVKSIFFFKKMTDRFAR